MAKKKLQEVVSADAPEKIERPAEDVSADADLEQVRLALESNTAATVSSQKSGYTKEAVEAMSKEEKQQAWTALAKKETTIGTKTYQSGGYTIEDADGDRLDAVSSRQPEVTSEELGGTIAYENGKNHYTGSLGDFTYDPTQWAVGTKTVTNAEGSLTTTVPVLRYIGSRTAGGDIAIPDGVTSLDYTFEGNKDLETVPKIPDSVTSAHCAFMGCTGVTRAAYEAKEDGTGRKGEWYSSLSFWDDFSYGDGGMWTMSAGLQDASGMFYDCTSLEESYTKAGKSLIFAQDMYRNTTSMGSNEAALSHGAAARMDCTQSLMLTPSATSGMYEGTNVDVAASYLQLDDNKNHSIYWDDTTQTMDTYEFYKAGGTDTQLAAIQELEENQKRDQVLFGGAQTDMYAVTGGQANHATVRDEMGYSTTSNVKDENAYADGGDGVLGEFLSGGNLFDRGLVSLGEYAIVKKLTGSTLAGVAVTFGGQALGLLPKSLAPILDTVTKFVGEDSAIGKGLTNLRNTLCGDAEASDDMGGETKAVSDDPLKDARDTTSAATDVRIASDLQAPMDIAASEDTADITRRMSQNGAAIVKDNVLLTVANKEEQQSELINIQKMMADVGDGMTERTDAMAEENGGSLTEEQKNAVAASFLNIMDGLKAYDTSASETIRTTYAGDVANQEKATDGLGKVMRLASEPMYQTMEELDGKYQIFSDAERAYVDGIELTGTGETETEAETTETAGALPVSAGTEAVQKEQKRQAAEQTKDEETSSRYGQMAEETFGHIWENQSADPEYGMV